MILEMIVVFGLMLVIVPLLTFSAFSGIIKEWMDKHEL